jgi:hypothetical protein
VVAIREISMRTALLVAGLILALVSVSTAMPVARQPSVSQGTQIHGCHQYYDRDLSGWHRHHDACDTFRGLVGSKNRNPTKG